jgi:hypothetical protein
MSLNPEALRMYAVPADTLDISYDVLDENGRIRVLPAEFWSVTTAAERALFGRRTGIYSFPTVELVDRLRTLIDGRSAIEIGAGHGVLAEALGIPATDNRMQERHPYRAIYERIGQTPTRYGPNVIELHASRAVRRYKPRVVIGCWVTHKYDPERHDAGGNEIGVDEHDILRNCETYIMIGNEQVHEHKAIWSRIHRIEYPPYLYSRALNDSRDFLAVWPGLRRVQ